MTNFGIKWNAEDLLKHSKPFSVAVDKNKRKLYNRGAVNIWEEVEKDLKKEKLVKTCMESFSFHYYQALFSLLF